MWQDPRTPVSVTQIGKWTVTIFDQAAYDESLRLYPDNDKAPNTRKWEFSDNGNRSKPSLIEKKKEARYNWISKDISKEMKGIAG